jgi:hypothetical protein
VTEGSDLQLECRVSCRPPPTAFSWFRDSNLIATEQNLTLRSIRSRDSGTYRYLYILRLNYLSFLATFTMCKHEDIDRRTTEIRHGLNHLDLD